MTPVGTPTKAAPPIETKAQATSRLRSLSKTIRDADTRLDVLRRHRNWGAAMLSTYHNVKPVVIYRDTLGGISRNLFVRITRSVAPEPPEDFPIDYTDCDALLAYTKKVSDEFNHLNEVRTNARAKRDPLILSVINGLDGVKMSNAEVSRATGLTTGRISHLVMGRKRGRNTRKR